MKVKTELNENELRYEILQRKSLCQKWLDSEVLRCSNQFIPFKSGSLKKSGITSTVIGSGQVEWQTPYARKQYYNYPDKSLDKNPLASWKWFEVAKTKYLKAWIKGINERYKQNNR